MMILGLIIFGFCTWAVFSKHFCDGLITKHFLVFAAILSMLVILNPENVRAGVSSSLLLVAGMAYWVYKHRVTVKGASSPEHRLNLQGGINGAKSRTPR